MRQCCLLFLAISGLGCHRELPPVQAPPSVQVPPSNPEATSSYIEASATGARSISVAIEAPVEHPLFLENCNGAINWGLALPRTHGQTLAWLVMRDACLSAPIEIKPGASRSFVLQVPGHDISGPASGEYQLVLLGVFPAWSGSQPMHNPEVPREYLLSDLVLVGP